MPKQKFQDLTGQKYGMLTVLARSRSEKTKGSMWICRCDCGEIRKRPVSRTNLIRGFAWSCGCQYTHAGTNNSNYRHGLSHTRLNRIWRSMIKRCKFDECYKNVEICDEWQDFIKFYQWAVNNGYSDELTIDRIDPNGNYEPNNCRWIPQRKNLLNRRTNYYITYKGKKQTVTEWSKELGINVRTLTKRLRVWDVEKAFTTPVDTAHKRPLHRHEIEFRGETKSITEWAKDIGVAPMTLHKRIERWGIERALTTPPIESGRRIKKK